MARSRTPPDLVVRRVDVGGTSIALISYRIDPPSLAALSAAERDVAARALAGATNLQIARARATSVRTVANLLSRAYRKLGVSSRRELAAKLSG